MLPPNSLKKNINQLIKLEVISGSNSDNGALALLERWADRLRSDEPFEGIPPELKLPLERIRKEAPEHQHMIELLVSQLQEYTDQALSEKRRNKFMNVASLVVGMAGFMIGAYQMYDTYIPEF
ncbi:hypothetical protein, partial [Vibrio parahaemolyticus]|uniref:hypothetical protein n=1 Tax=Vibrio parahaemolyticus TaxID=670 RepID=UPI00112246C0